MAVEGHCVGFWMPALWFHGSRRDVTDIGASYPSIRRSTEGTELNVKAASPLALAKLNEAARFT